MSNRLTLWTKSLTSTRVGWSRLRRGTPDRTRTPFSWGRPGPVQENGKMGCPFVQTWSIKFYLLLDKYIFPISIRSDPKLMRYGRSGKSGFLMRPTRAGQSGFLMRPTRQQTAQFLMRPTRRQTAQFLMRPTRADSNAFLMRPTRGGFEGVWHKCASIIQGS